MNMTSPMSVRVVARNNNLAEAGNNLEDVEQQDNGEPEGTDCHHVFYLDGETALKLIFANEQSYWRWHETMSDIKIGAESIVAHYPEGTHQTSEFRIAVNLWLGMVTLAVECDLVLLPSIVAVQAEFIMAVNETG
jgi:hypothetical protein